MHLELDRESWERGVRDGASRAAPPAWARGASKTPGRDSRAYNSGFVEGKAYRDGFEVSADVAEIVRWAGAR
jgi:hypothetical protein